MMTFKKKWISILASALAFVICCTFGVVFALDTTKTVSAETTYEYETYEELYTDDFTVYDYAKKVDVENNGSWTVSTANFLDFEPASNNTTASFVWNFKYTAVNVKDALNVYPLASGNWGAVKVFDFNDLPGGFTAGKTYDVEFSVLKIKNSDNYHVIVYVDGQLKYSDATYTLQHNANINQCIANGCSGNDFTKHTGIYFNGAGSGICSSERPEVVVDRLTNSDWKFGKVTGDTTNGDTVGNAVPTYWEWNNSTAAGRYIDFTPSVGNTTGSFVWEFDYIPTTEKGKHGVNIIPFAGGDWPQYGIDGNGYNTIADISYAAGELGTIYKMEVGVICTDVRFDLYRYYVSVDGNVIKEVNNIPGSVKTATNGGKGLFIILNNTGRGIFVGEEEIAGPVPPVVEGREYEKYDVLENADWTTYSGNTLIGQMPAEWTFENNKFLNFTPSSRNKSGSFIWQFKYKPTVIDGIAYIYPLASCAWGAKYTIDFNETDLEVGMEYDIEFGVVKIKNQADYYVYVKVDGEIKIERLVTAEHGGGCSAVNCSGDDYSKHTGLYFYFTDPDKVTNPDTGVETNGPLEPSRGICRSGEPAPIDYSQYVDTYDELYNQNWMWKTNTNTNPNKDNILPNSWAMVNGYHLDFTPTANNTTKSFIWRFTYTHTATSGAMNIYAFANGCWGNTANATVLNFNSCGFAAGKTYNVEICLLKLKDSANYEFFYVVDGLKKASRTISATWSEGSASYAAENADGLYFYMEPNNGTNGTCVSNYDVACESYDVLYNADWSIYSNNNAAADGEMPMSWGFVNGKFINFTPTKENTTGSYIWRFKYTRTGSATDGAANIYPLSSGIWGTGTAFIDLHSAQIGLAIGTEYDIELGVLRVKNSANYYIFVTVNGAIKFEKMATPSHNAGTCPSINCTDDEFTKHTGMYFYFPDPDIKIENGTVVEDGDRVCASGTSRQDGFVVSVNGEKQTVASGVTLIEGIGASSLLPTDRPSGYSVTWHDEQGNEVNGATVVTGNLTITAIYTYNYNLVNEQGDILHTQKHIYGTVASGYSDVLTVDRTTCVGYLVGDILYYNLEDAIDESAASGKDIVARTVTFGLVDGASIRVDGTPSIRFTAIIDKVSANEATEIVNYGMLLTTKATLDTIADFTITELAFVDNSLYHNLNKANGLRYVENPDYPNQYVYSLILDKVSMGNYGVQYVARAYAVVEYSDGTQEIIYSEFDKDAHTRSMYEVASAAIQDADYGYTEAQTAIIQQHIDGVIYLDGALELEGQSRNYNVTVANNDDGTYTITVTAKNGFDIKNIGAIYVGGEKIPVYDANLSAGTFVIKEEDMSIMTMNAFNAFLSEQDVKRELTLNAYSGPSLGLKVNSKGEWEDSGYDFTLADLETYMAAGFDAWRLEISPYTQALNYAPNGTVIKDVYYALDLAAQYAQKHNKPCKVYVHIPEVTGLLTDSESLEKIQNIYIELTNYDDGITKNLTGVSTVNGKNQIAGFLLKDEPKLSDATNFETMFKYLNDTCGAGKAGYDYQIALLQNYAGESNIGSNFDTYVATYATILSGVDSIGFDSYPFGYKKVDKLIGSDTEEYTFVSDWFYLMEKYSGLKNGYTACIQSYTAGETTTGTINKTTTYKTITNEAEISMQVYIALAYGYTNLDYFTYGDRIDYDRQVDAEIYQDVPVQWNDYSNWSKGYTLKSMYGWMQNTNAEAISLYDALGKFTKNGVQLISGTTSNNIFGSATTTNTTNAINVSSTYDMVVGGFKCGDQNAYLAVNADLPSKGNRTTSATFTLTGYTKAIVYVDGVPEVKRITNGTLTMNIGAGEGVFIVPMN